MKQNGWHKVQEYIRTIGPLVQGHELRVSIFKAFLQNEDDFLSSQHRCVNPRHKKDFTGIWATK